MKCKIGPVESYAVLSSAICQFWAVCANITGCCSHKDFKKPNKQVISSEREVGNATCPSTKLNFLSAWLNNSVPAVKLTIAYSFNIKIILSILRHSVHPKSIHYQNDVVYLTSTETASFSTFSHSLLCHPLVQWVASAVSPKFVNNTMRIWVRILLGHMFPVYYISSHHILAHDNILVVKMLLLMWTVLDNIQNK